MERRGFQISVASMLGLVACVAVNIWCFRVNALLGFVGLNITKHVLIAQLCQAVGVNRRVAATGANVEPVVSSTAEGSLVIGTASGKAGDFPDRA